MSFHLDNLVFQFKQSGSKVHDLICLFILVLCTTLSGTHYLLLAMHSKIILDYFGGSYVLLGITPGSAIFK